MTDSTLIRRTKGRKAFLQAGLAALIVIVLYSLLYIREPFPAFVNNLVANSVTVSVAGTSMIVAVLTARRYDSSEPPRRIWSQLAIGLFAWMVAELIWAAYNLTVGEVGLTLADLFWVLAYWFFIDAMLVQYKLLFPPEPGQMLQWLMVWVGSIVSLTAIIAWLLIRFTDEQWSLPLVVAAFYPAADFVISLASLRIAHRFRSGALGFPWIGLFIFAFADLLYAVLEFSGAYTWSVSNGNLLSTVADVTYVLAYLFVALGCYAQLLLVRHGPIFDFPEAPKET